MSQIEKILDGNVEPMMLGFLPKLCYFIYQNYIYRVIDLDKQHVMKGVRKITHIYVNPILFRRNGERSWHEVKSRQIEELPIDIMVIPCFIGPIFEAPEESPIR